MNVLLAPLDNLLEALSGRLRSDWPIAAFLLLPAFAILGVFGLYPMAAAIYMSLFGGKYGMGTYIGLENYAQALSRDDFWNSLAVTGWYALGTIPTTMLLSFLVAYALQRLLYARGFFRTLYFLPYITSAVAAAMIWRVLLGGRDGHVNALMTTLGLPAQQWLLEPRGVLHLLTGGAVPLDVGPSLALCCIMAFDIWHGSGFMIVVFLAGLSAIPRELEETARIDGANTAHHIRHVVLPLITPTVLFLSIVSTIQAFQAFNSFYTLTPSGSRTYGTTENLILYIYANFYELGYWGYAAAVATLLSLAIMLLTLIQWRVIGQRVYEA